MTIIITTIYLSLKQSRIRKLLMLLVIWFMLASTSNPANAGGPFEYEAPLPNRPQPNLEGVEVIEQLGKYIPRDLKFLNEQDKGIKLASYLKPGKPLLITMNYSTCPMLCSLQLEGMIKVMQDVDEVAGRDFQLLSVSYDPTETPQRAGEVKQRYLREYGKAADSSGWDFLVGKTAQVEELASTLGIKYRYFPEKREYSHPATIVFVTSDGIIARYLHGVGFDAAQFKQALVHTRNGVIAEAGSNSFFPLFCAMFDPNSGNYSGIAMRIMQIGALLFVMSLGSIFWLCSKLVKNKKQEVMNSQVEVIKPAINS